jgi:hypothetical protein
MLHSRSEKEGYVQAVIKEDLKWTVALSHLDQSLEDNANTPMRLRSLFPRYTMVTSNHGLYLVRAVHHASSSVDLKMEYPWNDSHIPGSFSRLFQSIFNIGEIVPCITAKDAFRKLSKRAPVHYLWLS